MSDAATALRRADEVLFVTHRHADRDSLGAAIGLRALLGRGRVCTPDGMARAARPLLQATGTEPVVDPDWSRFDLVVVLDTPSTAFLPAAATHRVVLVDHHERKAGAAQAVATVIDTEAGSTCELVVRLAADLACELTSEAALPLLVGLLDDTDGLQHATERTVHAAVRLFGALGDRASDLPPLVKRSESKGKATARLLGVLRATGYRAGDTTVATTTVGGHEAAGAGGAHLDSRSVSEVDAYLVAWLEDRLGLDFAAA